MAEQVALPTPPITPLPCSQYKPLVAKYKWHVDVALKVMEAESSCNAGQDTTTDWHPTCLGSRGLFQIGCDSTVDYAAMLNPEANIAQAYALYTRRGWQPWSSTTCRVKVKCY